ncbi:EamA family transporter, partial [Candidatus Gottesmanbacteria bacterium]|nr:EamA family transporter [Candidatus Gottesmanbacteria bacterium]
MPFYVFAWAAALFYGLTIVFGKLTSKYAISNIWLFNFLYALFTLLFTIPPAISNHVSMPSVWGNLILSSIFNLLFVIFYTLSIFSLDVSVISPLFNFRTAFGVILSVLILKEVLTSTQMILIVLIFVAGIFVGLDEKFSLKS